MHESKSQDTKTLCVPMSEPEIVKQIRTLAALKWGMKRIAAELGIARNSVARARGCRDADAARRVDARG